jgi:dolichol-phosphate mannosyltransferase
MTASTTLPKPAAETRDRSAGRAADRTAEAPLRLALVIPTLNEEGNIATVLDRVRAALEFAEIPFEILVVDDDSRDRTGAIVSSIGEEDPRVRLIVRKGQRGLSGAIVDGWRHTDAGILGVMDADLQHPPELLPALYRAIACGRDLAIGSRYTPGGGIGDWNVLRKLLSSAAVWATWPLQKRGVRAHDPMSGFFMVRRECVQNIAFQRAGFKLLLEILIRARIGSVEEIPFAFGLRSEGESKANFKVGWDYARLLVQLYARKLGLRRERAVGVSVEV